MSRLILAVAFFGLVALASAAIDLSKAEWTGKPWLGKWETVRDENWGPFVDALDLPAQYTGAGSSKAILKLWKAGDHFHHVLSIPDKHLKNELEFKLGEEFTVNKNGTDIKIKFTEDGDKLKTDFKVPSKNKEFHDVYEVNGEELVKTYKTGDVTVKRYFKKVPHTSTAAPAA